MELLLLPDAKTIEDSAKNLLGEDSTADGPQFLQRHRQQARHDLVARSHCFENLVQRITASK